MSNTDLDDRPWPFHTGRVAFGPPDPRESAKTALFIPEGIPAAAARALAEAWDRGPSVILAGPEPLIESLQWHDVAAGDMPDADADVLLWILDADGSKGWDRGWLDGDCWRLAESGGEVDGTVTHWSAPEGPAA